MTSYDLPPLRSASSLVDPSSGRTLIFWMGLGCARRADIMQPASEIVAENTMAPPGDPLFLVDDMTLVVILDEI
jgi:hypothetical protein